MIEPMIIPLELLPAVHDLINSLGQAAPLPLG